MNSIQNILVKYKMYSNSEDTQVTSGGLQQFISRRLRLKSNNANNSGYQSWTQRLRAIYTKDPPTALIVDDENGGSLFQCLPVDLKLEIFSYLDAQSLCHACCVCQDWNELTSEPSLWRHLLKRDLRKWSRISYLTNPQVYLDVNSDWSQKEIYLECSPNFHRHLRAATSTFHCVSWMIRALIPHKVPHVAMLGPGLETSTSGLVRHLLYEESNTFHRVAMFPGQFEGLGGGITLRLPGGHSLHLSVLYSASKQEREGRGRADRLAGNKLLQKLEGAEGDEAAAQYEPKPQFRQLCQTLDAFIFVVDASQSQEIISTSRAELQAMLRDRQTDRVPVLVLSCVARHEDARLPACDIVSCLDMATLTQPWLVIDCVTDDLTSVDTGFVWLVDQAQLR